MVEKNRSAALHDPSDPNIPEPSSAMVYTSCMYVTQRSLHGIVPSHLPAVIPAHMEVEEGEEGAEGKEDMPCHLYYGTHWIYGA